MYGQKVVRKEFTPKPWTPNTHGVTPGQIGLPIRRESTRPNP